MGAFPHNLLPTCLIVLCAAVMTEGFTSGSSGFRPRTYRTILWGKGVKRGRLGKTVASTPPSTKSKSKPAASSNKNNPKQVSAALAEWAATSESNEAPTQSTSSSPSNDEDQDGTSFTPFQSDKKKKKKGKPSSALQQQQQQERDMKVTQILEQFKTCLEEKASVSELLEKGVRPLLELDSGELRQVTAGAQVYNYRLAWVGSDEAVCHIGTGLHKVPLARLQEIYLTLQARSRLEVLEVIRVLGPFPNVRNTLQGLSQVNKRDEGTEWKISYDSMVDGLGKELLPPDENVRNVDLHVVFADPKAILAVVPPEDGGWKEDPLQEEGQNALLFVREDDLEYELEKLRVL